MNESYVIQWVSKVNGRAGKGNKRFSREEGERLVEELNREYPQIEHQLAPAVEPPLENKEGQPAPDSDHTVITE